MRGGCCRDQDGLRTAALHALLWCREELDRRWEIGGSPLVGAGLGVTHGHELDARLLKGEDPGAESTETAEADEAELETRLDDHGDDGG